MLPGFSAEAGLARGRERFRSTRRVRHANAGIYPAQRQVALGGRVPDGGTEAPGGETCHCPCCIRHHGHLVCC
jgi:hypothetical protein